MKLGFFLGLGRAVAGADGDEKRWYVGNDRKKV